MPSVWAVTKRVVKGGELPTINDLVDLYNYICLKYVVPVGGEDLDKCEGEIELMYASGDDKFMEIGGIENNPPEKGEIVYKDDAGVLCRKFNWKEADRTKLTEDTKNAVIVIEVLPPISRETLEKAVSEFKDLVQKYCGGTSESFILDVNNRILN
jgi:DNA/RNA-binding domain of Phe-tRNA-synthetase-like protein